MKIGILGAGLTGLQLARQLHIKGQDFIIFEKDQEIGGLAKTIKTGNYCWDYGVHAMYSKDKKVTDYYLSLPLQYQHSQRDVRIYHTGSRGRHYLVDYPFEEGVRDLPLNHRLECVQGYILSRLKGRKDFAHLKDWIDNCLGYGIAKHFMTPYNKKIWNCDLEYISMDLVSSKISPASVKSFLLAAMGKKVVGRAYQAQFVYPRDGIQAFMEYTAKDFRDKIRNNNRVVKLEQKENKWCLTTESGYVEEVDTVISTIPLVELLKSVNIPLLQKEYSVLRWNNTYFVMVGLKEGCDFDVMRSCHWAFFKEEEIFYRITMMHNFSNAFLPTLVAEVTCKESIQNLSPEEIKTKVISDLLCCHIIKDQEDVAEVDIRFVEHTYPIPTIGVQKAKDEITQILEKHRILLVGRSGHWDYINMDGVIQKVESFVEKHFSRERMELT